MAATSGATSAMIGSDDEGSAAEPNRFKSDVLVFGAAAGCAFAIYWISSLVLEARAATTHFGADAYVYALLAQGIAVDGLTRFHPLTIAAGLAWMKLTSPLVAWIAPAHLLKALFALVGAAGVWASLAAFKAVMPRRDAILFGAIYAFSLGVWYCASIEESKIVTATLSALYIATYLRMRQHWSMRGALLLTGILLLACLNEIVAALLVVIPAVDTLLQRGLDLRQGRWILCHALAGPAALAFLELVVNGHIVVSETSPERASHVSMFLYYLSQSDMSLESLRSFLVQWVLFDIGAPTADGSNGANLALNFAGSFAPVLGSYLSSPVQSGLTSYGCAVVFCSTLSRYRRATITGASAIFVALLAYAVLRAAFFFIYLPGEPLLNSAATTLVHLLLVAIPFAASTFAASRALLAMFVALLFFANGAFIFGGTPQAIATPSREIETAIEVLEKVESSEPQFRAYCRLIEELAAASGNADKTESIIEELDEVLASIGPDVLMAGYLTRQASRTSADGMALDRAWDALETKCAPR